MAGLHDDIEEARAAAQPNAKDVALYRDYYAGRQRGTHTPDQARFLRGVLGNLFADNLCRKIVNEAASRHVLLGWSVPSKPVADYLADLWTKNRMAALHQLVAIATLRDGNHAVGLRWQAPDRARPSLGRVALRRERWWDGATGTFVHYGGDGEPDWAVRDWTEGVGASAVACRTVYYPGRIQRYARQGDGWRARPLAGEPESGIVPWVRRDGRPLGIPIVSFAHGSADDGPYGASDLDGGVLGIQDEINDIQRDVTATARLTGYQMYWATGTEPERDLEGRAKPMAVGPGRVLQSGKADARYGVLPAGDLTQLKGALLTKIEAACRMTDTVLFAITGEWPSGVALLRADIPQSAKVGRFNNGVGPSWATVAHRSTEMRNTFGEGEALDESALIAAEFAPPERLDALTLAEIDLAKANALIAREALTDEQSLIDLGLPPERARAILRRREDRQAAIDERLTGIAAGNGAGNDAGG